MTTLYIVTRFLTFFGAEARTFLEHLTCRLLKLPIEDTRAFKPSELCAHVEHELAPDLRGAFVVCWLPFTLASLMSCLFLLTGAYRILYIGDYSSLFSWLNLWLGFSFAANCFPTYEDALNLRDKLYGQKGHTVAKILLAPYFAVFFGGAWLERYSVTFVTAGVFTACFPQLFTVIFPLVKDIWQMSADL